MEQPGIHRLSCLIEADASRVIARAFHPGDHGRNQALIDRVMSLPDQEVEAMLGSVIEQFSHRHQDIESSFEEHFRTITPVCAAGDVDRRRRQLIGAYFTMEYSIESAALFNPSIVAAPSQDGLAPGTTRFLMSLRAVGEGHVSSIVFRTGEIDAGNRIRLDDVSRLTRRLKVIRNRRYDQGTYRLKLIEMGAWDDPAEKVLERLEDRFDFESLQRSIREVRRALTDPDRFGQTAENMLWLARSNYHLEVPAGADPSEIVIFPSSETESRGIEDLRMVRFTDDDGSIRYYGTYTAYNGYCILPQLLETADFRTVAVHTLNGRYVQNKGLALFPRKVGGWHLMVSRLDGENLFLMKSDNVRFWNDAEMIQAPRYPWELVQIGNCGSPIETDAGWLLLTHGVGPVRQYCIAASLLDRNDPSQVVGQMSEPLLVADASERDGYVPNVVYTCGAIIHHDTLLIPYAVSDSATKFATVSLPDLLAHLKGPQCVTRPDA